MKKDEVSSQPKAIEARLKFFPIMMFAIVMGFGGTTLIFQKAHEILGFSAIWGNILAYLVFGIFAILCTAYVFKIFLYFDEVKKEFSHPVRINFFAATAISFLLISILFHNICNFLSLYSFYIGTALQTFFTFYTMSFWINKNMQIDHSNPAWLIPIVGNVLVPVAGTGYMPNEFLIYFFSIGVFFWLILSAILLNRIIFHNQLAQKFMPTLFLFIAPPAVSLIAYVKMFNTIDTFVNICYSLALFFTFLLFFMIGNFVKLKFFISWWAFTFPLAAMTISSMLMYKKTHFEIYSLFSYIFMAITIVVVVVVLFRTFKHMAKREICIQE